MKNVTIAELITRLQAYHPQTIVLVPDLGRGGSFPPDIETCDEFQAIYLFAQAEEDKVACEASGTTFNKES